MSLLSVIRRFKTGDYSVTRRVAATLANGVAVPGSTSAITIAASVQPVTGRHLKVVPEGRSAEDVRVIYTDTELKTISPTTEPDKVTIGGDIYEVFKVHSYGILATYYRAYAARQVYP